MLIKMAAHFSHTDWSVLHRNKYKGREIEKEDL